jgi:CBS domain-containing protein
MQKKVAPRELIQQDFRNLKSSERLYTSPKIEDLIFMQSIEGRAHNGAGAFNKRSYVNTTIDDIVRALGRSPKATKTKRQELIDEIVEFVDSALGDDPRDRLVTRNGKPFLGIPFFKEKTVNYHDILKGLYLGGLRDDVDIRSMTEELFNIDIGYGRCYLVDTDVMGEMGLDAEDLAHDGNEERLEEFKSLGLIVDETKTKYRDAKHIKYLYIRHHVGPGESDDTAIVASGLMYNVDVALGVFLADAIDTLEKYVSIYRDQDNDLARYIKENYTFLDCDEKDACELSYVAAIPRERIDEVPDSSLRYLLSIDEEAGQSAFETHINFVEGKPIQQMPISHSRVPVTQLYEFIKEKLKTLKKDVVFKVPEVLGKELESSVAKVMQRRFITVSPHTSLKTALQKAEARKSELIIVKDENGNILGIVNPNDFLVFLRGENNA